MKKLLLGLIAWYKSSVSPGQPPACRFTPTCSEYAYGAISRFGAFRGLLMGGWRILRCNPFSKGGFDPVPDRWQDAFHRKKTS